VAWALIALVLSGGVALLSYELTRAELVGEREDRATSQAYLNARLLRSGLRAAEPEVAAILASLEDNVGSTSVARVGGEWYSGTVGGGPDVLPQALVEAVGEGSAGRSFAAVDGDPHVVVGVPVAEADVQYFELVSLADVDRSLAALARGLTVGASAATVAAALAGWLVGGRVLRPLRRMSVAASGIAAGSMDTRLATTADPDLAELSRSFNAMADAVEERIEREHRFTSDVSHELRSPLAAMLSAIQVARRHHERGEDVGESLDALEERTEAFHDLVVDLLEISRVDAGVAELQREALSPRALVEAVVATLGDGDVPIEVVGEPPEVIEADKRRLGRMVMNLVDNAERYAGGATRVELSGTPEVLRIAVEDAGPGVPEHERRHVFGRFARGERARRGTAGGTGLGLSLVAEHAGLHGGRAWVEEAPGGGARFVIELPVVESSAAPEDP
jgi:signal transduction histidine kinase